MLRNDQKFEESTLYLHGERDGLLLNSGPCSMNMALGLLSACTGGARTSAPLALVSRWFDVVVCLRSPHVVPTGLGVYSPKCEELSSTRRSFCGLYARSSTLLSLHTYIVYRQSTSRESGTTPVCGTAVVTYEATVRRAGIATRGHTYLHWPPNLVSLTADLEGARVDSV